MRSAVSDVAAAGPASSESRASSSGPRPATVLPQPAEPEPIDLLELAGGAALSRFAPAIGAVAVVVAVVVLVRRLRNTRRAFAALG